MAEKHDSGLAASSSREITTYEKPIVGGVRKESKVEDQLIKEIPIVTER